MKLKFEKKYICFGITAFLVIAASICFYYLLFHWDRFSARIHCKDCMSCSLWYDSGLSADTIGKYTGKKIFDPGIYKEIENQL